MTTAERGPEAAMASCGVDVNARSTVADCARFAPGALTSGWSCALRLEQTLLLDDPTRHLGEA